MKKLKVILVLLVIVCFVFLIGNIMLKTGMTIGPFDYASIDKVLKKDKDKILVVSKYFEESDYEEIYIPSSKEKGVMSVDGGEREYIQELEVVEAIEDLKSKGYRVIGKKGNSIYFQRWSNLDSSQGIAYTIDKNEPQLDFLIKCKPLSRSGWYYYEENYDEWLLENTTNGIPNYLFGEWSIQYAKTRGVGEVGEEYPLNELYSEEILNGGVKLVFNSDGTFIKTMGGALSENSTIGGTYILRYENKILLKCQDGSQLTVKYLPNTQEIVYYTRDVHSNAVDEYYKRSQMSD